MKENQIENIVITGRGLIDFHTSGYNFLLYQRA